MSTFKTPKGTELPILNLRGKDYLEVKYRIVWFREEHPTWGIETAFQSVTDNSATAKAMIKDETGRVVAMSHKTEDKQGFADFLEKAETGAIGRALALIGFGTQFCADELDEGKRIVDSPATKTETKAPSKAAEAINHWDSNGPGDYVIGFGKDYKGKKIKDVPQDKLRGFIGWAERKAAEENKPLTPEMQALKKATDAFYGPIDPDHH